MPKLDWLKNKFRSPRPIKAGTTNHDQYPLYFRPTYALPDQGTLIVDLLIFPERETSGVDRVSGMTEALGTVNKRPQDFNFNHARNYGSYFTLKVVDEVRYLWKYSIEFIDEFIHNCIGCLLYDY